MDLLVDTRIPEELRCKLQGCSFEAEVLDILGFVPGDGSRGGERFKSLYQNAERLSRECLPYVTGSTPVDLVISGKHQHENFFDSGESDDTPAVLLFLGGCALGVFCLAGGCFLLLL
jgi:hypothetical protein